MIAESAILNASLPIVDDQEINVSLLLRMPVLEWTSNAADQYGALAAQLQAKELAIGVLDTMIAAHALAAGLTVVTHNMRDFKRVPGLVVVDWMT